MERQAFLLGFKIERALSHLFKRRLGRELTKEEEEALEEQVDLQGFHVLCDLALDRAPDALAAWVAERVKSLRNPILPCIKDVPKQRFRMLPEDRQRAMRRILEISADEPEIRARQRARAKVLFELYPDLRNEWDDESRERTLQILTQQYEWRFGRPLTDKERKALEVRMAKVGSDRCFEVVVNEAPAAAADWLNNVLAAV